MMLSMANMRINFVGLIQSSVAIEVAGSNATATCSTLSIDLAGSASKQAALECILSEFVDVFEKLA